jgi:predicted RNase H-like nuclease (RuvC/YqgF family)|tara:strand:+ start:798 stop:983 length:186 start_codon:yes stop_codon:yes gene_type:complete
MPVVEKKPIVKTNENITEVKIMVKSLKYEVGSLKQDIKEMKELINKYISDQQELSKKGWLY